MSSMVCQNFQSCFEPRALGLQVAASNQLRFLCDMRSPLVSEFDSDTGEPQKDKNIKITATTTTTISNNDIVKTNLSSWSSIGALTKEVDEKKERTYVHPLVKRSSSSLSEKSLELCTENLGCETGTNVSDNINFSTSSMSNSESWRKSSIPTRERSNFQQYSMHEKVNRRSFPPPLTTITSCDCVQFRTHREGGRLVIKAIAIEVSNTYFQAERGNGRLRLLLKEQFEEKEAQEEEEQEETEEVEDVKESISDACLGTEEQIDENGELGIGNFQRPSRCMEGGNKELSNWEHFWVAT